MYTTPNVRFPTCPAYQNMSLSHTSYTHLAGDRAESYVNERNVQKILPYPTNFLYVQNSNCYSMHLTRAIVCC